MYSQLFYEALESRYKSQVAEYEATLMIYTHNGVGIGEHPQHFEEIDTLINKLTTARDNLHTVQSLKETIFQVTM